METMNNIDIKNFTTVSSVECSDYVVVSLFRGTSGKISVNLLRRILSAEIKPRIGEDGIWYIGETSTEVRAVGKTPLLRKSEYGVEYKYSDEPEDAWRLLIATSELKIKYSDLTEEEIENLKLKYSDLTEEEVKELQRPAIQMISLLESLNEVVTESEEARVQAENARIVNEALRQTNEDSRSHAEFLRSQEYATMRENVLKATSDAIEAADDASHTPIIENHTWWVWDIQSDSYIDTGTSATSRSPQIIEGVWWVWNDEVGKYESTGFAANTDFQLTKQGIESVLTGNIETHTHDHVRYRAQMYDEVPDFQTLVSWEDELGKHPFRIGNEIYVKDNTEPTGYANFKLSPSSDGNIWTRIPQVPYGYRILIVKD